MPYPKVVLKTKKDRSLLRKHPWVFSGAVKKIYDTNGSIITPNPGSIVRVFDNKDHYLGTGHWDTGSIAVRIFSFDDRCQPDEAFWAGRLQQAVDLRKKLGLFGNGNNCCRLVFAEGDLLPGLIADYYNGVVVLQCHGKGMYAMRELIAKALTDILGPELKAVYHKPLRTAETSGEYLYGQCEVPHDCTEHDMVFKINWEEGQKTGFFLDQRENRLLFSKFCKGKDVLNCFGYTGGFSVSALKGGAKHVATVDSSAAAIALCDENIAANGFGDEQHESICSDVTRYLKCTDKKYDAIVLDPPAYAKHRNARHKALMGYKRLNETAMHLLNPGGLLFTFSCSQVVTQQLFYDTVTAAAINCGRHCRVLATAQQPADHPVGLFHPEGHYLKGLLLELS